MIFRATLSTLSPATLTLSPAPYLRRSSDFCPRLTVWKEPHRGFLIPRPVETRAIAGLLGVWT